MEYLGNNKPVNIIQPVVSVCITTYNHADYIGECLDSVVMQEADFPYEIILGEDDSKDGTREICKAYAEKYPDKIRLFLRDEKDKTFVNGRKTGRYNFIENLKAARGKYIALCDGDDFWIGRNRLNNYLEIFNNTSFIALYSDFETNLNNVFKVQSIAKVPTEIMPLDENTIKLGSLLKGQLSSLVFRRSGLNKFLSYPNQNKIWAGDGIVFLALLSQGAIGYINAKTNYYRLHEGGATGSIKSSAFYEHRAIEYQLLKDFGVLERHLDYLTVLCRLEVLEKNVFRVRYHIGTILKIIVVFDFKLIKKFFRKCVSGLIQFIKTK